MDSCFHLQPNAVSTEPLTNGLRSSKGGLEDRASGDMRAGLSGLNLTVLLPKRTSLKVKFKAGLPTHIPNTKCDVWFLRNINFFCKIFLYQVKIWNEEEDNAFASLLFKRSSLGPSLQGCSIQVESAVKKTEVAFYPNGFFPLISMLQTHFSKSAVHNPLTLLYRKCRL